MTQLVIKNVLVIVRAMILMIVALSGLVVSVLATGPKVSGFKPGRGRWILRAIKSVARLPSEGKESRPSHVIDLRHVEEPYKHEKMLVGKI
jgi:hypothetical protein